jgi:hypothetical protein
MNQARKPVTFRPYTWATPLCRPRLATLPTYLCRYSTGSLPLMTARMLSARRFAWRTACWALGEHNAPGGPVRSGTAAQSPAPQAPSTTVSPDTTCRVARQLSRPLSSRGRSVSTSMGDAFTPAVHTIVSAAKLSPSDSFTTPSTQDSKRVSSRMSSRRLSSCLTVYAPMSRSTSGRIRWVASTRTQCMSSGDSSG